MTNILAALNELLGAEREVARAWGRATVAAANLGLTQAEVDHYTSLRDEVFSIESALYAVLVAPLRAVGLQDRIPTPTRMPDAPAANAAVAVAGLGNPVVAVPIGLWVGAVLIALAEIAAVVYVVIRLAEVGSDLITRIYQVHSNAARYDAELEVVNTRFNACLRAGGTPQACAAAIPVPRPLNEPVGMTPSDGVVGGLALLGAATAVGGLLWVGYKIRKGRKE